MPLGRLRAALELDKKRTLVLISQGMGIHDGLAGSTGMFPAPNPPLATLLSQIQACQKAQQLVTTRVVGAAEARDAKVAELITSLESERMYVQSLCDAAPEQAAVFIKAAAMQIATAATRPPKPLLGAQVAMPSGTVILDANGSLLNPTHRRCYFNWEYTLDGGKSFLSVPPTLTTRTTISGLAPLTTVGFRVSVTLSRQPQGEWSQLVSLLVR
jgi:hypothetical protein